MVARWLRLTCPLLLLLAAASCAPSVDPGQTADTARIEIAGRPFTLELALDDAQREQGLSDRQAIAPDGGMLFVFPDNQIAVRTFVMRRCLVPIDIIFLDPDGRIVAMHEMAVEPYDTLEDDLVRYSSRYPAQFVIELAGGTLDTLGLKVGQRIEFERAGLKARAR